MSEHLRCQTCSGSVVYDVAITGAACMFCGAVALEAAPAEELIPMPHATLPFAVSLQQASSQYRQWSRASWFYPKVLRELQIQLQPMLVPAWRFYSQLETHWAGLRRSYTRSGKEPVSGQDTTELYHMVPASAGLSQAELSELQPFDESAAQLWNDSEPHCPWEPPALSEQGGRIVAHRIMTSHHASDIARRDDLLTCKVSPVIHDQNVRLFMLPIYIGAFRFRDRPWRFVVNAQTGEVEGNAPIDRLKVALLALFGLAVLAAFLAILSGV